MTFDIASGKAAAARIQRAAEAKQEREYRAAYSEYAGEARALGMDVEPFEQWTGEVDPKAAAMDRMLEADRWCPHSYLDR